MSDKKYNLPLSTPKGSDLDHLLKELTDGIKSGILQRRYFEIETDKHYPGRYCITIEFEDISVPSRVIADPDMLKGV